MLERVAMAGAVGTVMGLTSGEMGGNKVVKEVVRSGEVALSAALGGVGIGDATGFSISGDKLATSKGGGEIRAKAWDKASGQITRMGSLSDEQLARVVAADNQGGDKVRHNLETRLGDIRSIVQHDLKTIGENGKVISKDALNSEGAQIRALLAKMTKAEGSTNVGEMTVTGNLIVRGKTIE